MGGATDDVLRYTNRYNDSDNSVNVICQHSTASFNQKLCGGADNAAPYRKGGHRETCFSVRVDAHYKFMFDSGSRLLYELLIGFMFAVLFLSVLLIATCGRLSWPAVWLFRCL